MATNPLDALREQIERAAALPDPTPYDRPADDPLAVLRARFEERAEQPDVNLEDADTILGREILAMAASRPLSAQARAEALRRLAVAIREPNTMNVRAVLRVVATDRTDV